MAECDVCGKEADSGSTKMRLYSARVKSHAVEKSGVGILGGEKISTAYERFQPVEVTVCSRHKWELVRSRIMPGIILFVLLILLVTNVMWAIFRTFDGSPITSFIVSVIVTLVLVFFALRLVAYDGLIASLMTQRDRPLGLRMIYMTERKYQRLMSKKPGAKKAKS